jgi:hypothetical protein
MPIPPRRKIRDLLVPRDATETARQGQGIGDIEAMKQMATKAVPEALRMAPATSTGMSILDAAVAAANKDYKGAGMAALGAIPFAGMIDDVGKAVPKVFPKVGNALDALKQFAADMAEDTAILRRRSKDSGYELPRPLTREELTAERETMGKLWEQRSENLGREMDAATQRVNQAKIAHQEATAFRRSIPDGQYDEYAAARKKEQELKDAWVQSMEERRMVWGNNPFPQREPK